MKIFQARPPVNINDFLCNWFRNGHVTLSAQFKANPETFAEATWRAVLFFLLGLHLGLSKPGYPTENEVLIERQNPDMKRDRFLMTLSKILDPIVPEANIFLDFSS